MTDSARIVVVDNYDSFVYTIVGYLKTLGATVDVVRNDAIDPSDASVLDEYDGVLISPGPGAPADSGASEDVIRLCAKLGKPMFGVCLGLQALAEAYGGELRQLAIPMHGKPSRIRVLEPGIVFSGLGKEVTVGRYHSIFADPSSLPRDFMITAESDDGTIMGIEHVKEPIAAVQFHPESIMTLGGDAGMRMIENVVAHLARKAKIKAA